MNQDDTKLKAALLVQTADAFAPGSRVLVKQATFQWQREFAGMTGTVVKAEGHLVYVDLKEFNRGILNGFKPEHLVPA